MEDNLIFNKTVNAVFYDKVPFVSIITPVYNRKDKIKQALNSVKTQTYRDIEHIIVDDGSNDNPDPIIHEYMDSVEYPVMHLKKPRGGVHTARNAGLKQCRGVMYCCLDSDDEFVSNGIEAFVNAWKCIPDTEPYFEIKARCIDQNGEEVGPRFPDNINEMPWEYVWDYYQKIHSEHVGFRRMDIMRNNLWPEPEGVSFVGENIVWYKLRNDGYKTWLINDVVQIYHTEGNDHLDVKLSRRNRTLEFCINMYWNITYELNEFDLYGKGRKRLRVMFSRELMYEVLKSKKARVPQIELTGQLNRFLSCCVRIPAFFAAQLYVWSKLKP